MPKINRSPRREALLSRILSELLAQITKKLGTDPLSHPPSVCLPWNGTFQKNRSPTITFYGTTWSVARALVEAHNDCPLPLHPATKKPYFIVRPHGACINPWHCRVHRLTDLFEFNLTYEHKKWLFPDELKQLIDEYDEETAQALYPLNFQAA